MKKNYHGIFLLLLIVFVCKISAQAPEIFTVSDFDLNGNVKKCTVITDYGKEIFEFDIEGRLVKSVTQYNESDQDITLYKYENDFLMEKRMESYKNDKLDTATSMANFYQIDTTSGKMITEKIISYDKEFIEGQQYNFDKENKVVNIITSHLDAVDETVIQYDDYKGERTQTFLLNGVVEKSIRESERILKTGDTLKIVLTKEFIDGQPLKAIEESFDGKKLVKKTFFQYDGVEEQFVAKEEYEYLYDSDHILKTVTVTRGKAISKEDYIFQFDDNEPKNWVKKIVTPDNKYTTRVIEYYPLELVEDDEQ